MISVCSGHGEGKRKERAIKQTFDIRIDTISKYEKQDREIYRRGER